MKKHIKLFIILTAITAHIISLEADSFNNLINNARTATPAQAGTALQGTTATRVTEDQAAAVAAAAQKLKNNQAALTSLVGTFNNALTTLINNNNNFPNTATMTQITQAIISAAQSIASSIPVTGSAGAVDAANKTLTQGQSLLTSLAAGN